uniref:SRCR domain-containing protein n=1 Tax=Callorhinchus milii TaxID=7868 RepID=A0A4W3GQV4_CALMI
MLLVMLLADHLRLVNGGSPCAGRVEVYHDGQWGTVDGVGFGDSGWDMLDAAVVCKELGCGAALSASGDAHFGEGSGPVVTDNVQCKGSESTLRDCQSQSWSHRSWSHAYDAGLICSGKYLSLPSIFSILICSVNHSFRNSDRDCIPHDVSLSVLNP